MTSAGSGTPAADWPARARWLEIQVESRQHLQDVLSDVYSEILRHVVQNTAQIFKGRLNDVLRLEGVLKTSLGKKVLSGKWKMNDGREHRCKGKNATLTRTRLYEPNIAISPLMYRELCYTWL
ncbi:hypothetical protein G5I_11702 [Acromyrmex echinatior]|uniref:Uncharacterized protein n=1 Tax=Acromyrmex echinatior TaxID=103372 RepID=F4X095_ACREC|nr:hypothetical protein G5I_11702 [Acromyrmex echinatior]